MNLLPFLYIFPGFLWREPHHDKISVNCYLKPSWLSTVLRTQLGCCTINGDKPALTHRAREQDQR